MVLNYLNIQTILKLPKYVKDESRSITTEELPEMQLLLRLGAQAKGHLQQPGAFVGSLTARSWASHSSDSPPARRFCTDHKVCKCFLSIKARVNTALLYCGL